MPTHASHYPMDSEHLINTAAGHSIMHYHQDKPNKKAHTIACLTVFPAKHRPDKLSVTLDRDGAWHPSSGVVTSARGQVGGISASLFTRPDVVICHTRLFCYDRDNVGDHVTHGGCCVTDTEEIIIAILSLYTGCYPDSAINNSIRAAPD